MAYQGDLAPKSIIDLKFSTVSGGVPTTLGGTPAISIYKANGTTESTAGVTLTVDFDARTGLNHVRIDTSADPFYAASNDYEVVITAGTVGGVSVVGYTVGSFSIFNRIFTTITTIASQSSSVAGGNAFEFAEYTDVYTRRRITLTGLDTSAATSYALTLKASDDDLDSAAKMTIRVTVTPDATNDGLLLLNGAAPSSPAGKTSAKLYIISQTPDTVLDYEWFPEAAILAPNFDPTGAVTPTNAGIQTPITSITGYAAELNAYYGSPVSTPERERIAGGVIGFVKSVKSAFVAPTAATP